MLPNTKSASSRKVTGELNSMSVLSANNLSKAAPFLVALEQQLYQPIVPRKSAHGPTVPIDEAISMARRQQTDDSDGNDEESALSNYFDVPYQADSIKHQEDKDKKSQAKETPASETVRQRRSVAEACWFLRDFIEARWPDQLHAGYIKIQCDLTMDEIKEFGRLDKAEGSKKCRKLVSAPVIHDAIGHALWSKLAGEIAAGGDLPGDDTQVIKAPFVSTSLTIAMPMPMSKTTAAEVAARRARSMRRRATDGDAIIVPSAPRMASTYAATTARARRRSDVELVRPHQVICTTCGSRAVPFPRDDDGGGATSADEYEYVYGEDGLGLESRDRKRNSISRRLSVKMNKTLTKLGEGLATGYGGNGVSRVTG